MTGGYLALLAKCKYTFIDALLAAAAHAKKTPASARPQTRRVPAAQTGALALRAAADPQWERFVGESIYCSVCAILLYREQI